MITTLVMLAFKRLAAIDLIDMASSAGPNPNPAEVERFMFETFKHDTRLEKMYYDAKIDDKDDAESGVEPDGDAREKVLLGVFRRVLESISRGEAPSETVSQGDVKQLVNHIYTRADKAIRGVDRETKSVGIREKLFDFGESLSEGNRESVASDIVNFVQETFSGEFEGLEKQYWFSRTKGGLKGTLLSQEMGRPAAAKEIHTQVFRMLLEGVRNAIEKETYRHHASDVHTIGAISAGVSKRIEYGNTGDRFDTKLSAAVMDAKRKVRKYINPLLNTGQFGNGRDIDTLGITRFLNENFVRKDLPSGTLVDVPLPDGTIMSAKSFKMELKHHKIRSWLSSAMTDISLDEPLPHGDRPLEIGRQDKPHEETEEGVVKWLKEPAERDPAKTNRDVVRDDIRGWVDEVMRRASIAPVNKLAVKDILLVKMGLVSSETEKGEFLEKWLGRSIPKFRAEVIDTEIWKELGEPFRKGWKSDPSRDPVQPAESPYSKEWKQQALVNKTTGEQFVGRLDVLRKEDQDNLEVVTKVHKEGDEPKIQHMLNWAEYSQDDRKADLNQALDVYDGEKWFEQSVNEAVRMELEENDETLAEAFQKFRPENIFRAFAKHSDTGLIRAMGYVKPAVALETGKTPFPTYSGIQNDIARAVKELGDVMMKESKDDDGALKYLSYKRLGKVASRPERLGKVISRMEIESIISVVSIDLARIHE